MITLEKLKEYEFYHGYYDGFYIQRVKNGINLTSEEDWNVINLIRQDLKIVNNGLASEEFNKKIHKKLFEYCDSKGSIDYLIELSKRDW